MYTPAALIKFPDSEKINFNLAIVYDKLKDYDDAIKIFMKVMQVNPKNAEAYNYVGYTYADKGEKLDEAYDLVQKALKLDANNGFFRDSLGWVYFKQGKYKEALAELLKATQDIEAEEGKGDTVIYEHIGDTYARMNDTAKAKDYYTKALTDAEKDRKGELEDKINGLAKGKDGK